jgi:hypothetical protein
LSTGLVSPGRQRGKFSGSLACISNLLRVRSRGKIRALNLDERSLIGILGRKIKPPFFPAGDGKRLLAQPFNDPVSKGKGLRTTHTYRGGGLGAATSYGAKWMCSITPRLVFMRSTDAKQAPVTNGFEVYTPKNN